MESRNQNLSLMFYRYLCEVIGTEDVIKTRRKIFAALDYFGQDEQFTLISSGSKAEGLDLTGSDFDLMLEIPFFSIYENVETFQQFTDNGVPFIMDTENTRPGFTQLKLFDRSLRTLPLLNEMFEDVGQESYISSKSFREFPLRELFDTFIVHGPCLSTSENVHIDIALCFRCKEWITAAQPWVSRSRTSWPNNDLIDEIVRYGVLFVPIGCKDSPNENLEWRISFSVAEKRLIYSFNHVQLFCYALLKVTLQDIIKKTHGDLLCSYFLKTILFWVLEQCTSSLWVPENLLWCFMKCFKQLIYCVEYNTCLHYFIPDNNMFENRFNRSQRESLLSKLRYLHSLGWTCLLQCETLQTFRRMIEPSLDNTVYSTSAVNVLYFLDMFEVLNEEYFKIMYRTVDACRNLSANQIHTICLSFSSQRFAQTISLRTLNNETNKHRYKQYRKCLCHLLMGINHDSVSGWLMLASFFYTCKQYRTCIQIIDYCVLKCTPDKVLFTFDIDIESQHSFNRQNRRSNFLTACKKCLIDHITFTKSSFTLPVELVAKLGNETPFSFPPVVFAHFLNFLCLHHLNDHTGKRNAFRDLEATVREMYFIRDMVIELADECLHIAHELLNV